VPPVPPVAPVPPIAGTGGQWPAAARSATPRLGRVPPLASFPSPGQSVWNLGPIPIRAYALCIIAGIVAAIWIGERRWVARGGRRGTVSDVAVWAVIFGLVGGRLYHVITDNELYFRAGRDPWRAFAVWEGGLGVWGAIALGGVGAWIGCRRAGIALPPFADAVAPGIAVAQAIGRWGNYFNQELFGRPTDLPWAVQIDPTQPNTVPGATTYHPTFLYESLWCLALAGVLVLVDRRFRLGHGRVFALYVLGYTAGRVWIEMLRIDTANELLGLRLNVWTSVVVFAGGLLYFLLVRGPRETEVEPRGSTAEPEPSDAAGDEPTDEGATGADFADSADPADATGADPAAERDGDPADSRAGAADPDQAGEADRGARRVSSRRDRDA
jgi:prolipoprotein diacylglyceryl transferase